MKTSSGVPLAAVEYVVLVERQVWYSLFEVSVWLADTLTPASTKNS